MNNKRNTRRGRAKRWRALRLWPMSYVLRGTGVGAESDGETGWWAVVGPPFRAGSPYWSFHESRAAAMKAAEHLATLTKPKRATWALAA